MALLNRTIARAQSQSKEIQLGVRPVLIAAGVAIVLIAMAQVYLRSHDVTSNYDIQRLEQQKVERETKVHQLEAEVASLSSLSRVLQEAKRLGLGPPVAQDTVQVNVPWSGADQDLLPTRYRPRADAKSEEQQSSWWQDVLHLLPFN